MSFYDGIEANVILLGPSGAGKSSLLQMCKMSQFVKFMGTEVDTRVERLDLTVDGTRVVFRVFDTVGQSRFQGITHALIQRAEGAIIVYDVTCERSFREAANQAEYILKRHHDLPVILVGNKTDMGPGRQVITGDGKKLSGKLGVSFFEVSAIENEGVQEVFQHLSRLILQQLTQKAKVM